PRRSPVFPYTTLFRSYRTDLFEEAGLEPPETLADVAQAAEVLDTEGRAGIVLGTAPGAPFTTQTLEAVLLAGGCELVDRTGAVRSEEHTSELQSRENL